MSQIKSTILLIIFASIFANEKITACSSFYFNSNYKILAKNFDWYAGEGVLIKNLRNQKKFAYGFRGNNMMQWTSKYGSITFNQIGKEFPYGGINEKGLVIEQLWFGKSEYQENNNKVVSELEWIQYQLDNYATVDEVIQNINSLTIKPIATIHYILADQKGNSAVIEFINGKVSISKNTTKSQVITNESVEDSKAYHELNQSKVDPKSRRHLDRYCILKNGIKVSELNPTEAFQKLDLVSENRKTYKTFWSIVYDIERLEVYYKSLDHQKVKKIALAELDFESRVQYSDINSNSVDFKNYTSARNYELLSSSMKTMDKKMDLDLANAHQLNPSNLVVDSIFSKEYTDLTVNFITKKARGKIYYSFISGAKNFKSFKGFKRGVVPVKSKSTRKVFYGFPKIEFALACFQDLDNDGKMEKNFLGMPRKTGFSNNKKRIFGIPPKYKKAKIMLEQPMEIMIKIK